MAVKLLGDDRGLRNNMCVKGEGYGRALDEGYIEPRKSICIVICILIRRVQDVYKILFFGIKKEVVTF